MDSLKAHLEVLHMLIPQPRQIVDRDTVVDAAVLKFTEDNVNRTQESLIRDIADFVLYAVEQYEIEQGEQ